MVDLVFMEKIARWLTNTQVKIKAEVADSNTQAQHLAQYLDDLERRTDACERPNLDKEVGFLALHGRVSMLSTVLIWPHITLCGSQPGVCDLSN